MNAITPPGGGKVLGFLSDLASSLLKEPAKEAGGMLADGIRLWRFKNQVRIAEKAAEFLRQKGVSPKDFPPQTLVPLLEACSLAEDENLSDLFAGLLANYLDPTSGVLPHPGYVKMIENLSPQDAHILKQCYVGLQGQDYHKKCYKLETLVNRLNISPEQVLLSYQNFLRLGICSQPAGLDALNDEKKISFSDYGWAFMKAAVVK